MCIQAQVTIVLELLLKLSGLHEDKELAEEQPTSALKDNSTFAVTSN